MQVILLERVAKLGQMGDIVSVKDGYARNFLLPQKKALWASEANVAQFEAEKAQLEARNLETKKEAELQAQGINVVDQAAEEEAAAELEIAELFEDIGAAELDELQGGEDAAEEAPAEDAAEDTSEDEAADNA